MEYQVLVLTNIVSIVKKVRKMIKKRRMYAVTQSWIPFSQTM